jgi:hypothetical protein
MKDVFPTKLFCYVARFLCSVPFFTIISAITLSYSALVKHDLGEHCKTLGFA